MHLQMTPKGKTLVVTLSGELDHHSAAEIRVKIDKALNDELDPLIHQAKMEGLVPRSFGKSDVLREAIRKELPVFRDKV